MKGYIKGSNQKNMSKINFKFKTNIATDINEI